MNGKNSTMNEYADVTISSKFSLLCSDCCKALGWTIINTSTVGIGTVVLKLQRDRSIANRITLCDLQRRCEAAFSEIEKLERSKTSSATIASIIIGLIGAAFMTGATFSYLGGILPLCIVLAIPGFALWGTAYFAYKKQLERTIQRVTPLINQSYDVIYDASEKAMKLRGEA